VHCADFLAGFRCALAAKLAGLPVITHVRGRVPHLSRRDRSFLWPLRRFVFVSADTRATFAFPVGESRSSVLYDGIDLPEGEEGSREAIRMELGIDPTSPVVGMVARVAPAKDYPTLINAARQVVKTHPGVRFLIVGQRSGVAEYAAHFAVVSRLIAEAGLESTFIFTDHRSDAARLMTAMDICVLATFAEGLPLVILEAMARRKPFVATNVGGIPEVIHDGETGLLVPVADAPALARALLSLLDDPVRAGALAAAAQAHVVRHFGYPAFRERVRALYDGVLDGTRSPGVRAANRTS
jgi:glycosyltransferase involved in cell wall biosynthesis